MTAEADYPNGDILVSPHWLAERMARSDVKVLDARGERAHLTGHIPRAIPVGASAFKVSGSSETCAPEEFADQAGELGVSPGDTVVCYEDISGPLAARLWWVFRRFGHARVRLLNGGLRQWAAAGYPLTTEPAQPSTTDYTLSQPLDHLHCSLEHAKTAYGRKGTLFWDTRTEPEYLGHEAPFGAPARMGHIPGAVRLEWDELIDAGSGRFKPAEQMRAILVSQGITPEKEVLTY
jgi:thiosulfate/3-mercaptopyruvate sulfurtransferase